MRKLLLALAACGFMEPVFAQELGTQPDAQAVSQQEVQSEVQTDLVAPAKRHNISIEYGMLNITDFAGALSSAIASIFDDEDQFFLLGDIAVNYGYQVGEVFETGLVFNVAASLKNSVFLTLMPRTKLNFNKGRFVNPYMEFDAGAMAIFMPLKQGALPMFHVTLFGLEIGKFYVQLLGWGQRGLFYAGFKQSF